MALGKHLIQAVSFVYALQCLTGKVDNNYVMLNIVILWLGRSWDDDAFLQRVMLDSEFIDYAIRAVEPVVILGILPELVARWFTNPLDGSNNHGSPTVQGNENSAEDPKVDVSTPSDNKNATTVDVFHENDIGSH